MNKLKKSKLGWTQGENDLKIFIYLYDKFVKITPFYRAWFTKQTMISFGKNVNKVKFICMCVVRIKEIAKDELDPDFRKRRREELKEEEEARKRRKKDKRHDINHIIKCSINSDTFKVWGIVLSIVVVVGVTALTLIYSYPVLLWEEFQCSVSTTTTQLPVTTRGYSTLATPRLPSYKLSSRSYFASSRKVVIRSFSQEDSKLDPNWVTGFIDGDGCFHISIVEDIKTKTSWRVRPHFQIGTHIKDIVLMEDIKNFFQVGSINLKHGSKSIMFRVQSIQELNVIIDHLEKYPLITKKYQDFKMFSKVHSIKKKWGTFD